MKISILTLLCVLSLVCLINSEKEFDDFWWGNDDFSFDDDSEEEESERTDMDQSIWGGDESLGIPDFSGSDKDMRERFGIPSDAEMAEMKRKQDEENKKKAEKKAKENSKKNKLKDGSGSKKSGSNEVKTNQN